MEQNVLIWSGNRMEASLIHHLLENNQIPNMMQTSLGSGFVMRAGDLLEIVQIAVPETYAETATALCEAFAKN